MAQEYLVKDTSLIAIADEIRVLSGKTGTMGLDVMTSTLSTENTNFETNLTAQDSLIAQIAEALELEMHSLPVEYQEVTYLESTGTQYIDTGLNYFADFEIGIRLRENASNKAIGNGQKYCLQRQNAATGCWQFTSGSAVYNTTAKITDYHVMMWKNNIVYADGVELTNLAKGSNNGSHMYLFTSETAVKYPNIIYFCKLWDNNTLVRNFIPCIRKSDNKAGMYDLVTATFFTNAGTGEFLYGELINTNYNSELQSNNNDLQTILDTINELPEAGDSDPVLQDKTVSPTTSQQTVTADSGYDGLDTVTVNAIQTETKTVAPSTSQQNVTPSSGKYLSQVTVNAMPTATQATPSITVNASGLITATATQTAGYVAAGTKSATKQLAFQAAKTITPTTVNQTAVSSGYYTGGAVTVEGDSNLVAGNIKSGVSIFGVNGTYEGSGGGDTSVEDSLITRTVSNYTNDRVTSIGADAFKGCYSLTTVSFPRVMHIGAYAFDHCTSLTTVNFPWAASINSGAFYSCDSLTSVSFPGVMSISDFAFYSCTSLTSVNFPSVAYIGGSAFAYCFGLTSVNFPIAQTIGGRAFSYCTRLTSVNFPFVKTISSYAFHHCSSLNSVCLTRGVVCTLKNSNAFSLTGIWSDKGSIFVPSSLVASYKAATNWVFFSNRIYSYSSSSGGSTPPEPGEF